MIISGGAGPVFLTREVIDKSIEGLLNPQDTSIIADQSTTNNSTTPVDDDKKLKTDDQEPVNNETKKALKTEYSRFEKYAIGRLGKTNRRDFTSEIINPDMLKNLNAVVQSCSTVEDIKLLFSKIKGGE
jgi:hypothetical protein